MDVDLRAWPITPTSTHRAEHGLNNDSFFVAAREGEYVVRIYRNTADPERVRYEHEVLGRLLMQELPYRVPAPILTTTGDTLAVLETPLGPRLAALFERIAGDPAELEPRNAGRAGRALAQLDAAFARLDLPVRPAATLQDVHPLVPDPIAALQDLDLGADLIPTREHIERVSAEHGALAGSLPRQIIHGDFAFPNVLVENEKLTGMLDFEFAGPDFRAADLATALYVIAVRAPEASRWSTLEAFIAGYRSALPLDPLEVAALPDLMLRRSAIGLVHWIGRWRQSIAPVDEPLARVSRGLRFATWLSENGPRIAVVASGVKQPR